MIETIDMNTTKPSNVNIVANKVKVDSIMLTTTIKDKILAEECGSKIVTTNCW